MTKSFKFKGVIKVKKYLLLIIAALFTLSACVSTENTGEELEDTGGKPTEAEKVNTEKSDVNLSDIEVTMPADFFEGSSEEEIVATCVEDGVDDISANDDGSYTLKIPKEEHELMLKEMKADIDSDVEEIIENMDIESIKEVSLNDNATELIVTVDRNLYKGDMEWLVLMDFSLHAMSYQILNGFSEDECDFAVVMIDHDRGEEFERMLLEEE